VRTEKSRGFIKKWQLPYFRMEVEFGLRGAEVLVGLRGAEVSVQLKY
jgi:hypothetical protein